MIEKLYSLDFPPGFFHTGTTYQAKGRWFTGNCVRFFQQTIQAIGGWVQRTLTGAPIAGTPNAMVSWQTTSALNVTAIGTTSGLYILSDLNVIYTITPVVTSDLSGTSYQWDLTTFGTTLMAVLRSSGQLGGAISTKTTLYVWNGDVSSRATVVGTDATTPQSSWGCFATPERFLVLLRGTDPGGETRDPLWTD